MDSIAFTVALFVCGAMALGCFLLMVFVLIAFIIGECQQISRNRRSAKREKAAEAARKESAARERRLHRDRMRRRVLEDDHDAFFKEIARMLQDENS